jgi:hypothetical protein
MFKRINVVCDVSAKEKGLALLKKYIPDGKVVDTQGGSIVMTIPFSKMGELKGFFRIIEGGGEEEVASPELENLRGYFRDWSISHATLEEVFMRVTRKYE